MTATLSHRFSAHTDQTLQCSCCDKPTRMCSCAPPPRSCINSPSRLLAHACSFHRRLCCCVPVDVRWFARRSGTNFCKANGGHARGVCFTLLESGFTPYRAPLEYPDLQSPTLCLSACSSILQSFLSDSLGPRLLAWSVQ